MKRTLPLAGAGVAAALLLTSAVWASTDGDPSVPRSDPATTIAPPTTGTTATSTPPPGASSGHDHGDMDHGDHEHLDDDHGDMGGHGAMSGEAASDDRDADGAMDHGATGHDHQRLAPLAEREARATAEERAAAERLAAETRAAIAPYEDIDAAVAAGYAPNRDQLDEVTIHYPNRANRRDDRQLDPSHPEGLVYRHNPDGSYLLLGAVYTADAGEPAPAPGGPMFSWHTHQGCADFYVAPGECTDTFRMLHVWTADGVVDPFTQPFRAALRPSP